MSYLRRLVKTFDRNTFRHLESAFVLLSSFFFAFPFIAMSAALPDSLHGLELKMSNLSLEQLNSVLGSVQAAIQERTSANSAFDRFPSGPGTGLFCDSYTRSEKRESTNIFM